MSASPNQPASGKTGVKPGLPERPLAKVEQDAQDLWATARRGTVPLEAAAQAFGLTKPSGGSWNRRLADLNHYGLIVRDEGKIGLSDLGIQLIREDNPKLQAEARKRSVANVPVFHDLIQRYGGDRLPPPDKLAAIIKYEFGRSDEAARRAVEDFRNSVSRAELLHDDGETLEKLTEESPYATSPSDAEGIGADASAPGGPHDHPQEGGTSTKQQGIRFVDPDQALDAERVVPNTSLTINLDLSTFSFEEAWRFLVALGWIDERD